MIRKDIEIIKEYVVNKEFKTMHFTVRTTLYDDSVQYWLDLMEIAKQDFPDLDLNEVKSVVYGGISYKGTRGVEFVLKMPVAMPKGYVDGYKLEFTL